MNERWSIDFVGDCVNTGIEVESSLGGLRERRVLARIASERGMPEAIILGDGRSASRGTKNMRCVWSTFSPANRRTMLMRELQPATAR
jgi:hypothetical protein